MNKSFRSSIFHSPKQLRLFVVLSLCTLLNVVLVFYRIYYTGFDIGQINSIGDIAHTRSATFMFLVWNLFLAWIPYLLSLSLSQFSKFKRAIPLLAVWLVFLPNAPYLVTDLLHVNHHPPVPYWYDTVMLFSFAWTGLLLGFVSMMDVQYFLENSFGKKVAAILIWCTICLCAFGVYLGRYQRWNTWDILMRPGQLFWDIFSVLMHPIRNLNSLGLAVVMFGVLAVGYLTVYTLVKEQ